MAHWALPVGPGEPPKATLFVSGPSSAMSQLSSVEYRIPTLRGPQLKQSADRANRFAATVVGARPGQKPFRVSAIATTASGAKVALPDHRITFYRRRPPGTVRRRLHGLRLRTQRWRLIRDEGPARDFELVAGGLVSSSGRPEYDSTAPLASYIPRQVDARIRGALDQPDGPPVIVIRGPVGAGKTRTALHAAQVGSPPATLIIPGSGPVLRQLGYLLPHPVPGVELLLWLDDLAARVSEGTSWEDLQVVLGFDKGLRVIGTLDDPDRVRLQGDAACRERLWRILDNSTVVEMEAKMTPAERLQLVVKHPSARYSRAFAARPLRLVPDLPATQQPGLNFDAYAGVLAAALRGVEPPQVTVGLFGPWGSGKSTLLGNLERLLNGAPDVLTVWFEAWRYEHVAHIVLPMLNVIADRLSAASKDELAQRVRRLAEAFAVSVTVGVAGMVQVGIDQDKARKALARPRPGFATEPSAMEQAIRGVDRATESLEGRRIVVFVDDLDRCSSDKLVGLLEAINVVLGLPGFLFVLALDPEVLTQAVHRHYPHVHNPHGFVEKMIDVPFHLPPMVLNDPEAIRQVVPHWDELRQQLPNRLARTLDQLIIAREAGNPRQIKRFLNSVLLVTRMMEVLEQTRTVSFNEAQYALVAVLGIIRMRFPEAYAIALERVLDGDSQGGIQRLREAKDPSGELRSLLNDYLTEDIPAEAVGDVMRLTTSTGQPIVPDQGT